MKNKTGLEKLKKALFFILITTVKVPLSRQPHETIDSVLLRSFETERFNNYNKLLRVYQFVLWSPSSTLDYCFRCRFLLPPLHLTNAVVNQNEILSVPTRRHFECRILNTALHMTLPLGTRGQKAKQRLTYLTPYKAVYRKKH